MILQSQGIFTYSDGENVESPDETIASREQFIQFASRLWDAILTDRDVISVRITLDPDSR